MQKFQAHGKWLVRVHLLLFTDRSLEMSKCDKNSKQFVKITINTQTNFKQSDLYRPLHRAVTLFQSFESS